MKIEIRQFRPSDEADVIAPWRESGLTVRWNDPYKDIQRKLAVQPKLFLVEVHGAGIVAAMMVGYDGHRGSILYLAVAPDLQGKGIGFVGHVPFVSRTYVLSRPLAPVRIQPLDGGKALESVQDRSPGWQRMLQRVHGHRESPLV